MTKLNNPTGLVWLCGIFDCSLLDYCWNCLSVSVSESHGNFEIHLALTYWHPSACLIRITAPASHCWQLLYERLNHDVTSVGQIPSFSVSFFDPSKSFLLKVFVFDVAQGGTVLCKCWLWCSSGLPCLAWSLSISFYFAVQIDRREWIYKQDIHINLIKKTWSAQLFKYKTCLSYLPLLLIPT